MKKLVSLTTATLVLAATALPVFAASPSTATVMDTPVTVSAEAVAAEGYTLDAVEQALVATTPAQAVLLGSTTVAEPTNAANATLAVPADPATIALAKAEILKNDTVKAAIARNGLAGQIIATQTVARADGKSARTAMNFSTAGLTPGKRVVILCYVPGKGPQVITARWRNGKLRATLPLPCTYSIVQ